MREVCNTRVLKKYVRKHCHLFYCKEKSRARYAVSDALV